MNRGATLRFLGTSDSQGVPRWWCSCTVCEEARSEGVNARTRPSVILQGAGEVVLIDAAPELRTQLSLAGRSRVDAAVITHAHNDHIAGITDLGDWTRWTGRSCPVYAADEVGEQLKARYGYLLSEQSDYTARLSLRRIEGASRSFAGYRATAFRVPHGFNGWSYALRFDGGGATWAYMPDCLGLVDLTPWRDLDLLVLGTSFYHETAPIETRSVYDVLEASKLVEELKPRRVVFTHMGHGVDRRKRPPAPATYAFDGLELVLP